MADAAVLNDLFAVPGTPLPENVVEELTSMIRLLSLSPQELFYKWESYVIKMGVESTKLDYKTVRDFKKDLQDAMERETRAKTHHNLHQSSTKKTPSVARMSGNAGADVFGMIEGMSATPPVNTAAVQSGKPWNTTHPRQSPRGMS